MKRSLDDWLNAYMDYTEDTEPSDLFRLWAGISVIASCLERKCYFNLGSLTVYPNMYIVLVAPSGGRKGTAMAPAYKLLTNRGVKLAADATTREALIRALGEAQHIDPDTLKAHASITIFSPELAVFIGKDNAPLLMDLTNWFDCADNFVYKTKHQGSDHIKNVWVNLIGAITPELLQASLPETAIGGGLTSRMIFVYSGKRGKTLPMPSLNKDLQIPLENDLEQINLMNGVFRSTERFFEAYSTWYIHQADNPPFDHARLRAYLERRPTHLLTLCMLLSASRSNDKIIDLIDFERAKGILELTERAMPRAFSGVGRDSRSVIIEQIMQYIAHKGEVSMELLTKDFIYDVDKWRLDQIIQTLVQMKFCKVITKGNDSHIRYNRRSESVQES